MPMLVASTPLPPPTLPPPPPPECYASPPRIWGDNLQTLFGNSMRLQQECSTLREKNTRLERMQSMQRETKSSSVKKKRESFTLRHDDSPSLSKTSSSTSTSTTPFAESARSPPASSVARGLRDATAAPATPTGRGMLAPKGTWSDAFYAAWSTPDASGGAAERKEEPARAAAPQPLDWMGANRKRAWGLDRQSSGRSDGAVECECDVDDLEEDNFDFYPDVDARIPRAAPAPAAETSWYERWFQCSPAACAAPSDACLGSDAQVAGSDAPPGGGESAPKTWESPGDPRLGRAQ